MARCGYCGRRIKELPYKCHRCNKTFCSKHRLPENHKCKPLEESKKHNQERWSKTIKNVYSNKEVKSEHHEKTKHSYMKFLEKSRRKTKAYFSNLVYDIKDWLLRRGHRRYSFSYRSNYVFSIILGLIISIVIFAIIYSNIQKLNDINFWIIKIGSVILLVSLFFILKYGWKVLKETFNLIKRQRNWIKYILIILILILLWQGYAHRTTILNPTFNYYENTDLKEIYSPIHIEEGKSVFSEIENSVNEITREDPEKYKTNPKTVKLSQVGNFVVYGGVNDYLAGLDRSISYYYVPPTTKDFILRDLYNDVQQAYLNPLVDKIKLKSTDSNQQARIAISMVQAIPYDWDAFTTNNIVGRYPYEVLYDMKGVCMEKANLMAFILRDLGFGVAIFEFDAESHRAVGIKCNHGNYNSNYCFIEATDYYPIGQIPSDYVGGADIRGATPEIVIISDGKTYG